MSSTYQITETESLAARAGRLHVVMTLDHAAGERAYRVSFAWGDGAVEEFQVLETWGDDCESRPLALVEQGSPVVLELARFPEAEADVSEWLDAQAEALGREMRADNDHDAWESARCT